MHRLSYLMIALFISQNVKADPATRQYQLTQQIDIVSENIQNADKKTDVSAELQSMINLQRDYEQTSCAYLEQLQNELISKPSQTQENLKQFAKKHLCGSIVSKETSSAFEVQYTESGIAKDIVNIDRNGFVVSLQRVLKDGSSTISNF